MFLSSEFRDPSSICGNHRPKTPTNQIHMVRSMVDPTIEAT